MRKLLWLLYIPVVIIIHLLAYQQIVWNYCLNTEYQKHHSLDLDQFVYCTNKSHSTTEFVSKLFK